MKNANFDPKFIYDYKGVKLKSVITPNSYSCKGCYFNKKSACNCEYSCLVRLNSKEKVNIIFKKVKNE